MNRALDVAGASVALALTSPVLAFAALAVKLEDGGPVLYRQTRVGKDGVGLPRYYVLVTWATNVALWNYLRRGVPATWEAAEGTRR